MIEKLLFELRSGGTFETKRLAARLGTTPELIEAMLLHLRRVGYIQPFLANQDGCGGCGLRGECDHSELDCSPKNEMILYSLVESKETGAKQERK